MVIYWKQALLAVVLSVSTILLISYALSPILALVLSAPVGLLFGMVSQLKLWR